LTAVPVRRRLAAGLSASVTASDTDVNTDTRRDRSHSCRERDPRRGQRNSQSHESPGALNNNARLPHDIARTGGEGEGGRRTGGGRAGGRGEGGRGGSASPFAALVHSFPLALTLLRRPFTRQAPLAIARVDGKKGKYKQVQKRRAPRVSFRRVAARCFARVR